MPWQHARLQHAASPAQSAPDNGAHPGRVCGSPLPEDIPQGGHMRKLGIPGSGPPPADRGSRRFLLFRRRWSVLIAGATCAVGLAIPVASFADSPSGCDFAPNGTTPMCAPPLAPSTFEGGDGNLLVNKTGNTDWANVSPSVGIDQPSGGTDNAFGQGTKEDNPNVTVVTGSIPPNKSDLTRFYESSEFVGGSNFLYLAWERSNVLGSANKDFEINQHMTAGLT